MIHRIRQRNNLERRFHVPPAIGVEIREHSGSSTLKRCQTDKLYI